MAETSMDPSTARYLARVGRGLRSVGGQKRKEILEELADSLAERARDQGGQGADFQATAVALAEPSAAVIRRYRDIYGYGVGWTVGALVLTGLLALLTRPQLVADGQAGLFVLATLIYLGLLIHYSLAGGWRVGLACGLGGAVLRLLGLGAFLADEATQGVRTGLFVAAYLLVTLTGIALGYGPGWLKAGYLRRYHWLD